MVRSQCHVLESRGIGTGGHALTVRLSPAPGREEALRTALRLLAETLTQQPGLVGLHLLRHETPGIAQTTEQKIRGPADGVADWVLIASGYDAQAVQAVSTGPLGDAALQEMGAAAGMQAGRYALACTAVPGDIG